MTPRERLERSIVAIETDHPDVKFNMGWWRTDRRLWGPDDDEITRLMRYVFNGCATAACAFGHCVLDPQLAADGLRFSESSISGVVLEIEFGHHHGYLAASTFFTLSIVDVRYIFNPFSYPADNACKPIVERADVVRRIRQVLDGGERDALTWPDGTPC